MVHVGIPLAGHGRSDQRATDQHVHEPVPVEVSRAGGAADARPESPSELKAAPAQHPSGVGLPDRAGESRFVEIVLPRAKGSMF